MSSTAMTPSSSSIVTSSSAKLPPSPASSFLPSPPGMVPPPGMPPGLPPLSPAMAMMGVGLLPQSMGPGIRPPPTSGMNLSPRGGLSPSLPQASPTSPNKNNHRFNNSGGRVMGGSPTKLTRMGQGQITCNCSQVFPNLDILERHMMSAHPENTNLVRKISFGMFGPSKILVKEKIIRLTHYHK